MTFATKLSTLPWKTLALTLGWGLCFWVLYGVLSLVLEFLLQTSLMVAGFRGWGQVAVLPLVELSLLGVLAVPLLVMMLWGRLLAPNAGMLALAMFPMVWNLSHALAVGLFALDSSLRAFGVKGTVDIAMLVLPPMGLALLALVMQAVALGALCDVYNSLKIRHALRQMAQEKAAQKAAA